jgi:hypothetical protein
MFERITPANAWGQELERGWAAYLRHDGFFLPLLPRSLTIKGSEA